MSHSHNDLLAFVVSIVNDRVGGPWDTPTDMKPDGLPRLLYIVPGSLSLVLGTGELERRRSMLQSLCSPGISVDVTDLPEGPPSIESMYDEYLSIPPTLDLVRSAARSDYDAVIIGCFGDPGVDAARELVDIPIVGPAEASMLVACSLGHRFSILTVLDSIVTPLKHLARRVGVAEKLASVRAVNIPVLELNRNLNGSIQRVVEIGEKALSEDGADTVILGCMSMGFLQADSQIGSALDVPVINPVNVAIKMAELKMDMGLSHSKRAYPQPPKLKVGPSLVRASP